MRDRLIELLKKAKYECLLYSGDGCIACAYKEQEDCTLECVADHLLANGVTVQEWISVKDRLPETISLGRDEAYSEAVLVWTSGRKAMMAVYDGIDFICPMDFWDAWGDKITHWMPLPQPPKGE